MSTAFYIHVGVIICKLIVHLLVIVQNKRGTVKVLKIIGTICTSK